MSSKMLSAAGLAVLLVFMPGCIHAPESMDENPLDEFKGITLSNCLEATTFGSADAEGKNTRPTGWSGTFDSYTYYLTMIQCQKIGAGSFEAHDATLLWEAISPSSFPESCREYVDDAFVTQILQNVWTSDAALSQALDQAMDTKIGLISSHDFNANPETGQLVEFSWATQDGFAGSAEILKAAPLSEDFSSENLLFWETRAGIAIAQLNDAALASNFNQGPSRTTTTDRPLQPSTLATAGLAALRSFDSAWTLIFVEGFECE